MRELHHEPFRRGEARTLERVYRANVAQVERCVRKVLLRSNRFTTSNLADLVQEVFLKAFSPRARASYDATRGYEPFLRALARNVVVDWLRRTAAEPPTLQACNDIELSAADPIGDQLFSPELIAIAANYLVRLPPELKVVHERRFVAGEAQEGAARALGISRQNLRTLEKTLIKGLRRELARASWPLPHQDRREESPAGPHGG